MVMLQVFDRNSDGFITRDELESVMQRLGEQLSAADLDEMIRSADSNGDGKVHTHLTSLPYK